MKQKPNYSYLANILKQLIKRVEEATVDIHSIKFDVKTMKLDMKSIKSDSAIMKVDIEKMRDESKTYKDEILTELDGVMGELGVMRDENALGAGQTSQLREEVESHEKRIKHLEKIQTSSA